MRATRPDFRSLVAVPGLLKSWIPPLHMQQEAKTPSFNRMRNRKEEGKLIMRGVLRIMFIVGLFLALTGAPVHGQVTRKALSSPAPAYPDLAKKMHLTGVVKVTLTVGPDGQIKSAEFQGGHPVLIEAVQIALKDWKYAPASSESKILVEFKF
jgi:TonB family protein